MKLGTFDNVGETNIIAEFGWNPPARSRSIFMWNIHFLWLLPSCLFPCAPAQVQQIEIITRAIAQKMQFGARKCFLSKCFIYFDVLGVCLPQNPQTFSPVVIPANYEIWTTSKPFKIDKKYQLSTTIKLGHPFRIHNQKLPVAQSCDEIAMMSHPAYNKSL